MGTGITTTRWDPVDHLVTEDAIDAYLDAAREDGQPALIEAVTSDVARARTALARRPQGGENVEQP